MGLYDTIRIEFKVSDWIPSFPIPDETMKAISFQTKDMECLLDNYLIDVAGHFWDEGSGFIKKNDPATPKLFSVGSKYKLHDGSILTIPFSGVINMYASRVDEYKWVEFVASFHRCTLESLHLLRLEKKNE